MSNSLTDISRFISLILRDKPEVIDITLDEHGFANVDEMIAGINQSGKYKIDRDMLDEIVKTDEKKRYSYNEDHTLIRANQGHSIPVDIELEMIEEVPEFLYHGTGEKFMTSIDKQGLVPKSRLYVHLSPDENTANEVGKRHGKPVIYIISARQMKHDGYMFYRSVNGVYLTKKVPTKYLQKKI